MLHLKGFKGRSMDSNLKLAVVTATMTLTTIFSYAAVALLA